jgi:hypothetical protein
MKKFYSLFPKSFVSIILIVAFCTEKGFAQTPAYFKGLGTSTNTIPMSNPGSHCQQIYEPADFNILPISGLITKIYFRNSVGGNRRTTSLPRSSTTVRGPALFWTGSWSNWRPGIARRKKGPGSRS